MTFYYDVSLKILSNSIIKGYILVFIDALLLLTYLKLYIFHVKYLVIITYYYIISYIYSYW